MKIALLTCESLPNLLPTDQALIPELEKFGITAKAVVWDNVETDWSSFDYLVFRNTWDYFEKEVAFNNWLEQLAANGIRTLNTIDVVRQNKHKFYLRDLE